jgi:hypothetical protein
LIEQCLGVLQNPRIDTFGEPAVDGRERVAILGALALIAPETGEAGG